MISLLRPLLKVNNNRNRVAMYFRTNQKCMPTKCSRWKQCRHHHHHQQQKRNLTTIESTSCTWARDENLKASIRKFDQMTPRPQSLQKILEVSSSCNNDNNISEINTFLREEFRIRCAERICMLDEKIPNFVDIPELRQVYEIHVQEFVEMRNLNPETDDFVPVIKGIVERGKDMVPLMLKGFYRLIHTPGNDIDEAFTNTFMNEFLLNRIGSNVLMSQYLAVVATVGGDPPHHPHSIVDPHCNVTAICRQAAQDVKHLCYKETGFRPTIKVQSYEQDMENFAFIPGVISYILQEILKNSAVATAKHRQKQKQSNKKHYAAAASSTTTTRNNIQDDDTISVIVCADENRVLIHVGDHAGGIPFQVGQHIWSYMYSTKGPKHPKEEQQQQQESSGGDLESTGATNLGGFGVGLPLSRLYASYLGGTINLVSLPGYGTHAYVFFPRLPEKMVETVPVRATGWEARKYYDAEFIL